MGDISCERALSYTVVEHGSRASAAAAAAVRMLCECASRGMENFATSNIIKRRKCFILAVRADARERLRDHLLLPLMLILLLCAPWETSAHRRLAACGRRRRCSCTPRPRASIAIGCARKCGSHGMKKPQLFFYIYAPRCRCVRMKCASIRLCVCMCLCRRLDAWLWYPCHIVYSIRCVGRQAWTQSGRLGYFVYPVHSLGKMSQDYRRDSRVGWWVLVKELTGYTGYSFYLLRIRISQMYFLLEIILNRWKFFKEFEKRFNIFANKLCYAFFNDIMHSSDARRLFFSLKMNPFSLYQTAIPLQCNYVSPIF